MIALAAVLYVLGMFPTYEVFDKTTEQSTFNKIWFTLFWPAVSVASGVSMIAKLFKKK